MTDILLGVIIVMLILTNGPSLTKTNELLVEIRDLLGTINERGRKDVDTD